MASEPDRIRAQVGPFAMVPVWLLDRCPDSRAIHLYALLGKYTNREHKAWPKTEELAAAMGTGLRSVTRAIAVLRSPAVGALETERRHRADGAVIGLDFVLIQVQPEASSHSDTGDVMAPVPETGHSDTGVTAIRTPVSELVRKNQIQYNQIQQEEGEAAGAAALPLEVSGSPPDPIDAFVTCWHTETTAPLPRCLKLTVTRRRHIRQRLIDRPLAEWAHVFELVQASAFCRGQNDRGWRADLDWIIGSPDVALKILEGKYDDRPGTERPFTAQELTEAKRVRAGWFGGCQHDPVCANYHNCVAVIIRRWRGEAA